MMIIAMLDIKSRQVIIARVSAKLEVPTMPRKEVNLPEVVVHRDNTQKK